MFYFEKELNLDDYVHSYLACPAAQPVVSLCFIHSQLVLLSWVKPLTMLLSVACVLPFYEPTPVRTLSTFVCDRILETRKSRLLSSRDKRSQLQSIKLLSK